MANETTHFPQRQAFERPGRGGTVPPPAHRWKPGQSGNPAGPRRGQTYPGRWLAALADYPVEELEAIIAGRRRASASKIAAARLLLDAATHPNPHIRRRAFRVVFGIFGRIDATSSLE